MAAETYSPQNVGHLPLRDSAVEAADRTGEIFQLVRDPETYEVHVTSQVTRDDYRRVTPSHDFALYEQLGEVREGDTTVWVNPTIQGGGVALINPTLVHTLREVGINAYWLAMEPLDEAFLFTKQMHNVIQRVRQDRITPEGKRLHWHWADELNGPVIARHPAIKNANFIIIDDPQPTPLIARLRGVNPDAKIIWRNHIDNDRELMSDSSTPPGQIADYLLRVCGVGGVDAAMFHPVQEFVWRQLDSKAYFAPATYDPFDNLNRHLKPEQVVQGMQFINGEIATKNIELGALNPDDVIQMLDMNPNRQRLTLVARFDPSKGMEKAMEMGVQTRRMLRVMGVPEDLLPEIVIVGNGSKDDPDGVSEFDRMLRIRREQYPDEKDSIILVRLKHNYDAINALMSRSTVVMQTSDREGLETRVSDAIQHGKPVVVSNRGGIKTQVVDGESGLILDYAQPGYDLARGAKFMTHLLTDSAAYEKMVASTLRQADLLNRREFTTIPNSIRYMRIFDRLDKGLPADKLWKMADLLMSEELALAA